MNFKVSDLWQHWTTDTWTPIEVNQRIREGEYQGCFYSEGAAGASKTTLFKFLKEEETGALIQPDKNLNTVLKVIAASVALTISWKMPGLGFSVPGIVIPLTILGNSGIAQGIESLSKNGIKDIKSQLPTSARVWNNLVPILKGGAACLALNLYDKLAYDYENMSYGWFTTLAICSWGLYTIYNPHRAALHINSVESLVCATPNPKYHATAKTSYDLAENWHDYAEGRIPLTCLMGMHSPGNLGDRDDKGDYVFPDAKKTS